MEISTDLLSKSLNSAVSPRDISDSTVMGLAERIEEAIASPSKNAIEAIAELLDRAMRRLLINAPVQVRESILNSDIDQEIHDAYLLGRLSFAQTLVVHAAELRVDDDFKRFVNQNNNTNLLVNLIERELSHVEIAHLTGTKPETVSRRLRQLRAQGVTDFRGDGQKVMNFLTPAGRAAFNPPE